MLVRKRSFYLCPDLSASYKYISLFWHRAPRYDPAAQQQSSPLAAAACNFLRVWLLLQWLIDLIGACDSPPAYTRYLSLLLLLLLLSSVK